MEQATLILVPGAWMGAWVRDSTLEGLTARGIPAKAVTLPGLEARASERDVAAIGLREHVDFLRDVVAATDGPVVLVSHSYSSFVAAQVADTAEKVVGQVHIGGFLPVDGRRFIDEWGDSDEERAAEIRDIEEAGNLWPAPTAEMLEFETDLTESKRAYLADRFAPHPGRTLLEPAHLSRPVDVQPTTYVALSTVGSEEAWANAPATARDAAGWRKRYLPTGHWPMVVDPAAVVDLLIEELQHYNA